MLADNRTQARMRFSLWTPLAVQHRQDECCQPAKQTKQPQDERNDAPMRGASIAFIVAAVLALKFVDLTLQFSRLCRGITRCFFRSGLGFLGALQSLIQIGKLCGSLFSRLFVSVFSGV